MSLLLLNASNRLAQGFIQTLHKSGNYERIVCADVFPTYSTIERLLRFKEQLELNNSKTQVTLYKVGDRQDLLDIVKECNNLLYVSHDYYRVTPSKTNLLNATLQLLRGRKYQFAAYVAPVELDHQGEGDSGPVFRQIENENRANVPELTGIRADVTFGPNSVVANLILQYIVNNQSLYFQPQGSPAPIFSGDLEKIVARVMSDKLTQGKSYLAQGARHVDWNTIVKVLEKATGQSHKVQLNSSALQKVVSPLSNNLLSEALYCAEFQNLTQLVANYRSLQATGYENAATLLDAKPVDLEKYYSENQVNPSTIQRNACLATRCLTQ